MEELIKQWRGGARALWRYRWLAAGVAWLAALAGWSAVALLPDSYQASARVYVDTQGILKPLLQGMTTVPNVEQQVAIMSRTLLSRPNLERVMRMTDLDIGAASPGDQERALALLQKRISITGTGAYDIYTITYRHGHARGARDVVQALLAIFAEGSFKGKRNDAEKAVQFLDEQIAVYEGRLAAAETTLKDFKLRHGPLLPRQGVDYDAQLQAAADALGAARLELAEAEQAHGAMLARAMAEQGAAVVPAMSGARQARVAAARQALDALRLQYTDLHPDVAGARRLLAQLEQGQDAPEGREQPAGLAANPLLLHLKVAQAEAEARLAAVRIRVRALGLRHARLQAQSKAAPEVESQLAQLNRDYDVNQDSHEKLLARREAARLSGDLSATTGMMNFRIIDPPILPARPADPDRPLYYSAILLGALALGLGAALAANQARPVFLAAAQLQDGTGLPVLGTVGLRWTPARRAHRLRHRVLAGAVLGTLVLAYGGLMSRALLPG